MAVYAVGDLQGCLDSLKQLLDEVRFDPAHDRLWLTGDLVNRGPQSLECLRFVRALGEAAITVLGNHDLHLLAVHEGVHKVRRKDTIAPIMAAPDCDELMAWLRTRPLMHHNPDAGFALIHAGLPPQWDLALALACASEVESLLRGPDHGQLLRRMYGDTPDLWSEDLEGWDRARYITNCFTRLRYCAADGRLDMEHKGRPGRQPPHLMPWYEVPGRLTRGLRILFGHWSTLGLIDTGHGAIALDTGCLWGGHLTAVRIDAEALPMTQVRCPQALAPLQAK